MPNWCEGKLKIRGAEEDVKRFLLEGLDPLSPSVEVEEDEYSLEIKHNGHGFYVKGTRRNFIEQNEIEWYKDGICILPLKAAWSIDPNALARVSAEFNIDLKIYAFEQGMQFNLDIEIHKGEIIKYEEIIFGDYNWECIDPDMGG